MFLNNLKQNTHAVVIGLLFSLFYFLFSASSVGAALPFALDWKTNTYTPPGYAGKKLPSEGSTITVAATPLTGVPTQYYYKWYLNGVRQNDWALGRTQFAFIAGSRDATIEMKAGKSIMRTSTSGVSTNIIEEVGNERIVVRVLTPQLLLYQERDEELFFAKETTVSLGASIKIKAIPYFYNVATSSALQFRWSFLGNSVSGNDVNPDELTLSFKEGIPSRTGILAVRAEDGQKRNTVSEIRVRIK